MRSLRPVLLGVLFAAVFAVPAFAQTSGGAPPARSTYAQCPSKTPSAEEQEKGHQSYVLGKEKYDKGKLEEAVTFFKAAYEHDCQNHDYLIIISRAYERQPNLPEAIRALETYVQRAPNAADIDKHRDNIESMKQRASTAATPTPTTSPTPQPTPAPTPPPTAPPPREQEHTIYPWLVTGVGVAALGTGLVFLALDPGVQKDCNESTGKCDPNYLDSGVPAPKGQGFDQNGKVVDCASLPTPTANGCSQSKFNQDRQNKAGNHAFLAPAAPVTMIIGGVLIAGGVIWHFAEPTGPKKESGLQDFRFAPVVTPGYSGLAMGARF